MSDKVRPAGRNEPRKRSEQVQTTLDRPREPVQAPRSYILLHLGVTAALLVGVVAAAYTLWWREAPPEAAPAEIVQQFARLHTTDRAAALRLLGPEKVFGETPVPEAEAEPYFADHLLRSPRLEVVKVLPGEPDGNRQKPVLGRFTVVTKAPIMRTPTLKVRRASGEVWGQDQQIMNPDIVVEVRDGRIIALRTELPLR